MEKPELGQYQPTCILAHQFINKLTVIVGRCDLLAESAQDNAESIRRLREIRDLAMSMAVDLNQHQCRFDSLMRPTAVQKPAESQRT